MATVAPIIDKMALELYEKDPAEAIQFLTDYCVNNGNNAVNGWWELGDNLLVKYNHFRIYDAKTRKIGRIETPELWNRAVVEYDKLKGVAPPPKKKRD